MTRRPRRYGFKQRACPPIAVSPDNPCPFLRAIVAEGYVGGHNVPLATLARTVQAASGKTGFKKMVVGIKTRLVAVIANGLSPFRLHQELVVRRDAR